MALMFLLGVFSKGYAQGQDHNYQWVGNDVSSVINNSNADMNTIYLYNVGTKKYLNIGSYWGTSISAQEVGMPCKITNNGDGTYTIQGSLTTSDGNILGFLMLLPRQLMQTSLAGIVFIAIEKQKTPKPNGLWKQ